ncbi:YheC/YheD family protein [Cytobacillus spongiae]|jgi:glutathione synthase/RimK-type ligase-like ATP-grasp enzyme|uniref:YheC/YheD family endospore coat-associated protein n=1 Tax=Cytobacillus spongiae TaxID=2901381 RepID=UPI001F1F0F1E|nr:YheC/YheD family protein [Cytobacillus spongiae]UII56856.1 YheC/YheD family protein [Cytobacillus spongiae]
MTRTYLPITIIPDQTFQLEKDTIRMSPSLMKYWGLELKEIICLCIGSKCLQVGVESAPITKDDIHLSELLIRETLLPVQEHSLLARYCHDTKRLLLGPIIALVTDFKEEDMLTTPNFRAIHTFIEELQDGLQQIGGFLYVFHFKDVSQEKVNGYYFDIETNEWKKTELMYPTAVYNRIHSRKLESSSYFQQFQTILIKNNIPMFNDGFFSKWDVHEALYNEEHLHPHLPKTKILTEESIISLLQTHQELFIKPIHGSQGRNIIRMRRDEKNHLEVDLTSPHSNHSLSFLTISSFMQWFQPRLKKRTYLVQQSIPLLNYKNRKLDFRVLCHKNHRDDWKVSSMVARLSAEEQFVSNIARGGETMRPIKALSLLFDQPTAIQQQALMKELAIDAVNILSRSVSGLVGELGVDIGVDEYGKLWIIEINSKPSKNFEGKSTSLRPSAKAILEYCTKLSFDYMRSKEE